MSQGVSKAALLQAAGAINEAPLAIPDENTPGLFVSQLADYPGRFRFPYPFMLEHFRAWWGLAVEAVKDTPPIMADFQLSDWAAARHLLIEWGEWNVTGVPVGDLKVDRVPSIVVKMVVEAGEVYFPPFFPPVALLKGRGGR